MLPTVYYFRIFPKGISGNILKYDDKLRKLK